MEKIKTEGVKNESVLQKKYAFGILTEDCYYFMGFLYTVKPVLRVQIWQFDIWPLK